VKFLVIHLYEQMQTLNLLKCFTGSEHCEAINVVRIMERHVISFR